MEFWEFVVLQVAVTELRTPRTTPRCTKVRVVDLHLGQGNVDSLQMLQSDHEWCGVAGLQTVTLAGHRSGSIGRGGHVDQHKPYI